MPQAGIAAVLEPLIGATAAAAGAVIIQTVLINVLLGSLEFTDEEGVTWRA